MTDRGILFSAPMIKALLGDHKIMTRRLAWRSDGKPTIWQKIQVGDRLWVRETWKPHSLYAEMKPRDMPESHVFYRADDAYAPSNTKWVPGIHMPRWASRITLTVTAVKVEPLHAMTDDEACNEGIKSDGFGYWRNGIEGQSGTSPRAAFALLWNSLHGAKSWNANPELVAMSFAVARANIDDRPPP